MSDQRDTFFKETKKRLIDLQMSQAQLAKMLGIRPAYLNDILQGRRDGGEYFLKIVKILKLDNKQLESADD